MRYDLNFADRPQTFAHPDGNGTDPLKGKPVEEDESRTQAPWDLVIIEERQ